MFEFLKGETSRILVTGPQRSGTTIAAKIIAADTGLRFVDETEFGTQSPPDWKKYVFAHDDIVVQCPTMFRYCAEGNVPDGALVVLVRRELEKIHESEDRINWRDEWERVELNRLTGLLPDRATGDVAAWKYWLWDGGLHPDFYMEIEYESLATHSLFVPTELRANFAPKQTA